MLAFQKALAARAGGIPGIRPHFDAQSGDAEDLMLMAST